MASPATYDQENLTLISYDSDYGSDFSPEEEIALRLLSDQSVIEETENNPIVNEIEHHDTKQTLRLPRFLGRQQSSPLFQAAAATERTAKQISKSDKKSEYNSDMSNQLRDTSPEPEAPLEPALFIAKPIDAKSPLEQFRTQPKKALSVTDLVSPAWCELQYWYTLTVHGRKRQTPAMKRGSEVHKELEDQVHISVKVDIETKEDAWGLRVWNVIQGLRTLRDTGQTRELEVWGTIDGVVVNGVVDELSYICPDFELEESLQNSPSKDEPPPDQNTLSEFFKASGSSSLSNVTRSKRWSHTKRVYICDVKTRSVRSLPSEVSFRPTKMQLMLYHSLLSSLATNPIDLSILASRYNLDTSKVFSDSFIAQIGSLNEGMFFDAPSTSNLSQESYQNWSQDSMSTILAHNSLSALWALMIAEFQATLPQGTASLGRILKAEYRSRESREILGKKTFAMDEVMLKTYLEHEMKWWKGEREVEGVAVEEAYKCGSCEFAERCEWRLGKLAEEGEKYRLKRKGKSII